MSEEVKSGMFGSAKHDDVDFHEAAAAEAGRPRENAFTHIGIFLAWLVRHDMHARAWFPRAHVRAVARGEMIGTDLADDVDWKLVSSMLSPEGAAFADACYAAYLEEYERLVADEPPYGVVEDAATYARVAPAIDRLYADWVAAGRPALPPVDRSASGAQLGAIAGPVDDAALAQLFELTVGFGPGVREIQAEPGGGFAVRELERPHAAPDLESLIPLDLADPPLAVDSAAASQWGSSQLNRALKQLGVKPHDAHVASGIGGNGAQTLTVTLYRVPGATADRLAEASASLIVKPPKSRWDMREIAGRTVRWADGRFGPHPVVVASWAVDGLVVHVAGARPDVEAAIARLPGPN
jgi:hypothetical protein